MTKETKEMYEEKAVDLLCKMDHYKPGTDEFTELTNELKMVTDALVNVANCKTDEEIEREKEIDLNESKKERLIKYVGYGVTILTTLFWGFLQTNWTEQGFEFERDGTFTSNTFKGFFNKRPKV